MKKSMKMPLLIYGLLRACSMLTGELMAALSLELIEASPLIAVGEGQSPEGKMPALGYLCCSHHATHKQSDASEQRLLYKPQRAQLSRRPVGVSNTAERLHNIVLFSREALVRAQFSPASLLAFTLRTAVAPWQHH